MGKWEVNEQDEDDFEQEKRIKEWLDQQGATGEFDFKHISSKGTARNTLLKASISLDQEISDDGSGTFADLIAGSDGRDLLSGDDTDDAQYEPQEIIHGYLFALGFNQGDVTWLETILKLSIAGSEKLYRTLANDSEW